jgi:hypothetical protein
MSRLAQEAATHPRLPPLIQITSNPIIGNMLSPSVSDQVQKGPVEASVVREFGVEGCGHYPSLPHSDGIFTFGGEDFYARTNAGNFRGANEDHLNGSVAEFSFADGAVNLAAIGIAANADIERAQSGLLGIFDFGRQKDSSGAGAEGRFGVDKLLELFESGFAEEFEKRARFAAGDDEAINLIELLRLFDEHNFGAQFCEPAAVRVEITL